VPNLDAILGNQTLKGALKTGVSQAIGVDESKFIEFVVIAARRLHSIGEEGTEERVRHLAAGSVKVTYLVDLADVANAAAISIKASSLTPISVTEKIKAALMRVNYTDASAVSVSSFVAANPVKVVKPVFSQDDGEVSSIGGHVFMGGSVAAGTLLICLLVCGLVYMRPRTKRFEV
jgi:hypothetical protein